MPPTLNADDVDEAVRFEIVRGAARAADLRAALSNSFGFGGTNVTLLFRRADNLEA